MGAMWINYQAETASLKAISLIGIDVTIPWFVYLSRLCIDNTISFAYDSFISPISHIGQSFLPQNGQLAVYLSIGDMTAKCGWMAREEIAQ